MQPDPDPATLQKGIILVEITAPCKIEQQISIFHPDIQPDIAAAAGHRPRGIPAGPIPDKDVMIDGRLLGRQLKKATENEQAGK